ncbi:MAG: hypothetical protein J6D20_07655 [Clostridia bacterium]|nr:hypothetical protein [Clostridia bacterium]
MKRFRFNKVKWDKIISAVVVVVLLVGCVAGLAAIFGSKTTDVSDFEFKKGALDSAGYYIKSDTSIYTKDLIECQGLVIEPDFEATGKYQVFYYSSNKSFIGASELLDAHLDGVYEKGNNFKFAKYCRIVISPDAPVDEDNRPVDEWKIHFWEVAGYADDYKITVNKKQNFSIRVDEFTSADNVASIWGEGRYNTTTDSFEVDDTGFYFTNKIDTSSATKIIVKLKTETLNKKVVLGDSSYAMPILYDADDTWVSGGKLEHTYKVEKTIGEFSYISYDVSAYNSIVFAVDSVSADVLEIYLQ